MRKLRPSIKGALIGICAGIAFAAVQTHPTPPAQVIPAPALARVVVPSYPVMTVPETTDTAAEFLGRPDDEWLPPKKGKMRNAPRPTKAKKDKEV